MKLIAYIFTLQQFSYFEIKYIYFRLDLEHFEF